MIHEGMNVKLIVVDGRKVVNRYKGIIRYITEYSIGIDTGNYIESVNVADFIAPDRSMFRVKFYDNLQDKFVNGYIKERCNPTMRCLELEKSLY